ASARMPVDVLWMKPGSSAEKAGLQKGDHIIQVQDIKNPTWDQFVQTELISPDQNLNVTVRRGDEILHKTLLAKATGPDSVGDVGLIPPEAVGYIEAGKPADRAGIKPGDILFSFNGKPVESLDDMLNEIQKIKSTPANLIVLRDGKEVSITVTPALLTSGTPKPEYRIGVSSDYIEKLPFAKSLSVAYADSKENSLLIFKLIGRMFQNRKVAKQVAGPIGIMQISGEAAMIGWPPLLDVMAILSLNLAVVNLFPIPILDGGLMLMLLIEAVMRRDIKQEIKERVYQVAFVFVVLLFVAVCYNDVARSLHM
ncbi:MAG TPA: site-2 protease family protein, partial [Candidatus Angelobacter sp.]|nr:site-2 protease family protein [Candidatus Angelobacter sp.]